MLAGLLIWAMAAMWMAWLRTRLPRKLSRCLVFPPEEYSIGQPRIGGVMIGCGEPGGVTGVSDHERRHQGPDPETSVRVVSAAVTALRTSALLALISRSNRRISQMRFRCRSALLPDDIEGADSLQHPTSRLGR